MMINLKVTRPGIEWELWIDNVPMGTIQKTDEGYLPQTWDSHHLGIFPTLILASQRLERAVT